MCKYISLWFCKKECEIIMEKDVLKAIHDLKNILAQAEEEKNYDIAKQTVKELFKCYVLLDNLEKNYSIACINPNDLNFFSPSYEEIQAEDMRKFYYEKELEEKKYNE